MYFKWSKLVTNEDDDDDDDDDDNDDDDNDDDDVCETVNCQRCIKGTLI